MGQKMGIVGSINMDLVVQVDTIPKAGQTVIGTGFFEAPGGKGANQAVAAARAGRFEVVMFGAVGNDDFGVELLSNLEQAGVETNLVQRIDDSHTGTALIMLDRAGENRIVVVAGVNEQYNPDALDRVAEDLRQCDALCVSLEIRTETAVRAVQIAHHAGLVVILDPAPVKPIPLELLRQVDVLTPNLEEARGLVGLVTGNEPRQDVGPGELARKLADLGIRHVLVTMGPDGVVYRGEAGGFQLPAYRVEAVDSVGAGDVFAGALAARLAAGETIRRAAEFANAAAALATTKHGAQDSAPLTIVMGKTKPNSAESRCIGSGGTTLSG